jgi:hypothetical protein
MGWHISPEPLPLSAMLYESIQQEQLPPTSCRCSACKAQLLLHSVIVQLSQLAPPKIWRRGRPPQSPKRQRLAQSCANAVLAGGPGLLRWDQVVISQQVPFVSCDLLPLLAG